MRKKKGTDMSQIHAAQSCFKRQHLLMSYSLLVKHKTNTTSTT